LEIETEELRFARGDMANTESAIANYESNPLANARLAFIGCGVMAEAIIAGLLRNQLVNAEQIVGSHPRTIRREELYTKYATRMFESNREAAVAAHPADSSVGEVNAGSLVILAVKPQRLNKVLHELKGAIHPDQLVVSIVAGAPSETIAGRLLHPAVVRAMPNTPAQIGQGMTAWTATAEVNEIQERQVSALLAALGIAMRVENERQIDMATALSATGPTYVFLMMEALVDAGVHMGFSRHVAQDLVQQMMLGSVLFAKESQKHPAELRNMVTSPGGTSAEAIYQMEKGGLRTVLSKAVWAAYQRAEALGAKSKDES
jgi:pyrroline-5-carboxylate reductase